MNTKKEVRNKVHYFDYSLLAIIMFLMGFGLIMLYSASSYSAQVNYGNSMHFFLRQGFFCVFGFATMLFVAKIDYHKWAKFGLGMYVFSFFLMALVLTPLGKEVNHARRWIRLPMGQTFQPSEFTKIAVIAFVPVLLCHASKKAYDAWTYWKIIGIGALAAAGVYILTDNLSTAVIVMGIVCVVVFLANPKTAKFVIIAAVGTVLLTIGIKLLDMAMDTSTSFRLRRILVWLHPEEYIQEGGYQVMQGLYAIGSGGFFGKGLGNSAQKMMIPEAQNDMIFSIICEELGLVGASFVVLLFLVLIWRLYVIASHAKDLFGALIASGAMGHMMIQVILNIAVVTNTIPNTGITLPFISYGGSSLLSYMLIMGIVFNISNENLRYRN